MIDRSTSCAPARVVLTAVTTYVAEVLFSVWTVAYNFVPGGEYTREHTDYLLAFVALTIGLALFTGKYMCIGCRLKAHLHAPSSCAPAPARVHHRHRQSLSLLQWCRTV